MPEFPNKMNDFSDFFAFKKMLKTNTVLLLGYFYEGSWFFEVSDKEKEGKHLVCSLYLEEPIYFEGVSTPERVKCRDPERGGHEDSLAHVINAFQDSCRRIAEEEKALKLEMKTFQRIAALEKALSRCQKAEEPSQCEIFCLREILNEEKAKCSGMKEMAKVQISQFRAKRFSHSGKSLLWDERYSSSGDFEDGFSDEQEDEI